MLLSCVIEGAWFARVLSALRSAGVWMVSFVSDMAWCDAAHVTALPCCCGETVVRPLLQCYCTVCLYAGYIRAVLLL